ncbi:hypothetical protein EDD85DRAFT_84171 [Armillaria nabsnona]|nr:hypothetical protein EDD85DRAFT_84171 [Armillaria nabsnona]
MIISSLAAVLNIVLITWLLPETLRSPAHKLPILKAAISPATVFTRRPWLTLALFMYSLTSVRRSTCSKYLTNQRRTSGSSKCGSGLYFRTVLSLSVYIPLRRLHVLTLVYFITTPVVLDIPTCNLDICTAPSFPRRAFTRQGRLVH